MAGIDITRFPIHLGPRATADVQPEFTGDMAWYRGYGERHGADGVEARLVSVHSFDEPWDTWEVHPHGNEVVLCLQGAITLHQERPDGSTATIELGPGEYAINEPGVWHTADTDGKATALFITPGLDTEHRPR